MIIVISLFLVLIATFYTFVKIRYNYWKNLNIPGPEPKFPMGTFDRRASPVMNMVKYYNKFKGNGPFCGLINFFAPAIVVTDPALIKSILIKDFQYFHTRGIYYNEKDDPLSAHLFSIDGQKWKTLRTKLAPSFTSVKMKYMFSTVLGVSEIFKNVILHKVENNLRTIEMKDVFARFTTDVIGTCAFGVECNSLVDPDAKFREKGLKFFDKPRHARFGRLFMTYAPQIAKLLRFKVMSDDVAEFFMSAVEETVNHRMMNNIQRNDFMDLLIKMYDKNKIDNDLSKGLTLNEIAAQAWVFFLAGFETSSTAMSYTLYELAQNQELQEKARKNILTALKAFDGQITYESLQDMTFLEQCINEGMRKYPPVPTLIRRAVKDYKEPITGVTIRQGQMAFIPVYAIHHDAEYYPEPEKYDPDRFAPEATKKRDPCVFLPFGEGPRICVALRFGMVQAKIGLAMLLSNFRFKLNPKTPVPLTFNKNDNFILASDTGLYFDIEKL